MAKTKNHANGSGTVYKRVRNGKTRWYAELILGIDAEGKRIIWRASAETRRQADDALSDAKAKRSRDELVPPDKQTVEQFLETWLTEVKKPKLRPKTYMSYEIEIRLHINPIIGKIELQKLKAPHVQHLLNDLGKIYAPRSVAYVHAILRAALNQAVKWDIVPRNVVNLVEPPRIPKGTREVLTVEQAQTLLAAVKGDSLEALFVLTLVTGLRQGEVLGLRWQDVDLDNGQLTVNGQLQRLNHEWKLLEPKTGTRVVPIAPIAVAALRAHRGKQTIHHHWGLIFTDTDGSPLYGKRVYWRFKDILKENGLPPLRFHDLRHTAATLSIALGAHPREIMELLGHSEISTTMNIYGHVLPTRLHEIASRLDAALHS